MPTVPFNSETHLAPRGYPSYVDDDGHAILLSGIPSCLIPPDGESTIPMSGLKELFSTNREVYREYGNGGFQNVMRMIETSAESAELEVYVSVRDNVASSTSPFLLVDGGTSDRRQYRIDSVIDYGYYVDDYDRPYITFRAQPTTTAQSPNGNIQSWNYTPAFRFYQTDRCSKNRYYGMEIEVNSALSSQELFYILTEVEPKQDPFFYFMSDSSIDCLGGFDNCYEIVTMPSTAKYLRKNWKVFFKKLTKLAEAKGFELYNLFRMTGDDCGIHIHTSINPSQFRNSSQLNWYERKFLAFWNRGEADVQQRIAGRDLNSYCHQPHSIQYMRTAPLLNIRKDAVENEYTFAEHHIACCTTNKGTLEVRVFRGLFDLNHMLHCLDSVVAVQDYILMGYSLKGFRRNAPVRHFLQWLSTRTEYNHIKEGTAECA